MASNNATVHLPEISRLFPLILGAWVGIAAKVLVVLFCLALRVNSTAGEVPQSQEVIEQQAERHLADLSAGTSCMQC